MVFCIDNMHYAFRDSLFICKNQYGNILQMTHD